MSIRDRHIVVTGGGTGVGAETAQLFAEAGAKVTIMGRSEAPLQAQGLPYQICDVTDAAAVTEAFSAARDAHGPVAAVVANAGAADSVPFAKMTPEVLNNMLAVNLVGVANVWQAALPDMKAQGWGRMIAIASTAGLKGYPYVAAYCAAKHGVVGLTRALALELAGAGITVNAICPGFIETPMLDRSVANITEKTGKTEAEARAALYGGNPQKRFIQTDEVAQTALWLCSDAARSINGHALSLSGGEI
ncbi:D-beta-hydroxybutyrate dehydrogenase [Tritonibacter multivorans]|uniref:D-beta-hydroxybutyrate dehydrogenase n=1 Tax=Tritonibacter multivorans TaxID=928856 RepID=A0A0P1FZR4_9RHOB|nr:SDR family NAD(P)-dependent oxidoreductase [Tritonibacter multivorans]MDA7422905.1 SDR family NAD(P)-dependent oxidoreductase [Tritonibacter multivorans]CUH74714.1 D-beta-hydroxybutyrate dehydrogenase [Tritonibacter multivorans]SFD76240.1 NAD(P)-dependent dehydrogenase, short-chain alcohol dehydrogenase family [Tritonibacter multivorans]